MYEQFAFFMLLKF